MIAVQEHRFFYRYLSFLGSLDTIHFSGKANSVSVNFFGSTYTKTRGGLSR